MKDCNLFSVYSYVLNDFELVFQTSIIFNNGSCEHEWYEEYFYVEDEDMRLYYATTGETT